MPGPMDIDPAEQIRRQAEAAAARLDAQGLVECRNCHEKGWKLRKGLCPACFSFEPDHVVMKEPDERELPEDFKTRAAGDDWDKRSGFDRRAGE